MILMTMVVSNYWKIFDETYQGIWDAENKADTEFMSENHWPQETDNSKRNFRYLPEINKQ